MRNSKVWNWIHNSFGEISRVVEDSWEFRWHFEIQCSKDAIPIQIFLRKNPLLNFSISLFIYFWLLSLFLLLLDQALRHNIAFIRQWCHLIITVEWLFWHLTHQKDWKTLRHDNTIQTCSFKITLQSFVAIVILDKYNFVREKLKKEGGKLRNLERSNHQSQ